MNFLTVFNPGKQSEYVKFESRCFLGTAPSIIRISKAYGYAVAESWLEIQLQDLSEYSGVKDKMQISQLTEVAKTIISNYGYLKVTEMMVFFQRFKADMYGKFYGAVDGLVITSALFEFLEYRSKMIDKFNKEAKESEQKRSDQMKEKLWRLCCELAHSTDAERIVVFNIFLESN